MKSNTLKQQDVVLAVHLLADSQFRTQTEYANELGICQAEICSSLKRLSNAHLIDPELKLPYRRNLKEFIVHGLKYVFPAKPGAVAKGMATAYSAPPLCKRIRSTGLPMVWAAVDGKIKGQAIEPLYKTVPEAAKHNPRLYEVLAIIDSIRVGKARERAVAIEELEKRL